MNSKTPHQTNSIRNFVRKIPFFLPLGILILVAGCSDQPQAANTGSGDTATNQESNKSTSTPSTASEVVYGKPIESEATATVTKVMDGDTIRVKTQDGEEVVVRMESIDAPEGNARYASMVLQQVTELLEGKEVQLQITGTDGRGRTLAFVLLDGENMNAKMIELGLVKHFKRYSKAKELADLEAKAKEQYLNIWSAGKPAPDGTAANLKAPLSLFFWNVESGGAETELIAEQLAQMTGHAIYGLCEVPKSAFDVYEKALGENFKSVRGTHFKEDHLQLIYDDSQLELLSWNEIDEVGDIRMNLPPRVHRSPLLARFKQRDGGVEFYVLVNHLARGNAEFRQKQAAGLREWARTRQMPIIAIGDYNFDYVFETEQGNQAFSDFLQDNIWKWIKPEEMIDTNWYDEDGDGVDDYPGSMLDFMFVAGSARDQQWKCEVIVREGDFPDDQTTSDHRPVVLSLQANESNGGD